MSAASGRQRVCYDSCRGSSDRRGSHPGRDEPGRGSEHMTAPRAPDGSHILFRNVFGARMVAALLDYVAARQPDFRAADSRPRRSADRNIDPAVRQCLTLSELGPYEDVLATFLAGVSSDLLTRLGVDESKVEPMEFELSSYADGGHFRLHTDTLANRDHVRIVSCAYYFSVTPRRFEGGELRLHGEGAYSDIEPVTDTLVAFPSSLRHEVLPIRSTSTEWIHRRFSINCWLHRTSPSAHTSMAPSTETGSPP